MPGKRSSDSKSAGPVRKRKKIDLEQKMKIVKKYEGGQSLSSIARELDLATSTVKSILNDSARIKEHVKGSAPLKSTVITKQRSGAIYEMEKLLTIWMDDQIQKRMPLSLMIIQAKAKSIFEDVKGKYSDPNAKFAASHGWFNRFKQRANFHNVKVSGEAASADTKAAEKYPEVLRKLIEECGYTAQQIFNVNETGLFWKKMPDRTYISKEEKTTPGFKAAKDRLTLLLGGNAAGDCKLKPLLVYHSENPRVFKGISEVNLPVHFRSDRKAWITMALFEDWFINLFIPEVEKFCRENDIPFKIMLIVDNAPGHPAHLDDFHPNVKVVFLPPNKTSILQPMAQGVIANFKACYLRRTFAQAVEATDRETGKTLRDFWKSYNIYQAIINIAKAWAEVTQVCLNAVWKKVCPQFVHSFKGFEKDRTYEEVADEIVKLAEQLELEIDVGDVDEFIESHGAELSNEDLMELEAAKVKEQTEAEDEVEVVEAPRHFNTKEMALAFREIDSALARFEKMDPNSSRFLKVNSGIDKTLACYRQIYEEKKKATIQSSLNTFVRKTERPATSTSPQPSTAKAPSDDPNDVMPVSSSPSSSTN